MAFLIGGTPCGILSAELLRSFIEDPSHAQHWCTYLLAVIIGGLLTQIAWNTREK